MTSKHRWGGAAAVLTLALGVSLTHLETQPRWAGAPALDRTAQATRSAPQVRGATSVAWTQPASRAARPSPDLTPEEAVRLQLEALRQNDTPFRDAGVQTAFNFASPDNQRFTGPLDRFSEMLYSPVYRPLLNHRSVRYQPADVYENEARQSVVLVGEDALRVGYIFLLSRQKDGPCEGCWLTDSVIRFEVPEHREGVMQIVKTSAH